MMKNIFNNNYESTMICLICGKIGVVRCTEHVDIEFESDEVDASLQYIYPTISNTIFCNQCKAYMIQCKNDDELKLMRSIIDLGFDFEHYSSGRVFSDTISTNAEGMIEVEANYIHPALSVFIPINDRKRCINIIERTKALFDGVEDIRYEFYAEYGDFLSDRDYYNLEDIVRSLENDDIDFECIQLSIYCGISSGVITDEEEKGFDGFVKHCLSLMNSLKELDA